MWYLMCSYLSTHLNTTLILLLLATILSVMGGADFVGRIILGIVGNCECLNTIHLFGGCTMMPGLACILSLLAKSTSAFYVFAIVFGFSVGTLNIFILISTIFTVSFHTCLYQMAEILRLNKQTGV